MRISIILAHPDAKSFNHAIAHSAAEHLRQNGHSVVLRDLYAEGFDPLLPACEFPQQASLPDEIDLHCREISAADGIVIVHPNWWGQPPAILKGWVDRVIRPGVAYKFLDGDSGEGLPVGLLKAKAAVVLNTSNTSPQRELAAFGDPLETLWKNCIFGLCGVANFRRETFGIVVTSSEAQRKAWLGRVREIVDRYFASTEPLR